MEHPRPRAVLVTSLGGLPEARSSTEFAAQLTKPVRASQLFDALMSVFAEHASTPEPAASDGDGKPVSALRILLAEDNAVNQKLAIRLLERLGYKADLAENGLEVLDALELPREWLPPVLESPDRAGAVSASCTVLLGTPVAAG